MPILGQHDMGKAQAEPVDDGNNRVAIGDRQRAARAKVILHVNDQQKIVAADGLAGKRKLA